MLFRSSPGCSLEGLMLKLKLQYFGHLMQRVDSLEKTLMLGGIGSRRKRGRQRMRWLDGRRMEQKRGPGRLESGRQEALLKRTLGWGGRRRKLQPQAPLSLSMCSFLLTLHYWPFLDPQPVLTDVTHGFLTIVMSL